MKSIGSKLALIALVTAACSKSGDTTPPKAGRTPFPIAATITSRIDDFETWKTAFDASADLRKEAGILGHHVSLGTDDPTLLVVFIASDNRDKLERFLASAALKDRMRASGVVGAPTIALLVPQEDRLVRGRKVAAALVSHEVENYDRWKAQFDAQGDARRRAGIIGHAVSRSATNPNAVVVYVQAESTDQLRAMFSSSELAAEMQKAGVTKPPQIKYLETQYSG